MILLKTLTIRWIFLHTPLVLSDPALYLKVRVV
jgi:hypothetical protein